jgi:hypothetical protein
MPQSNIPLGDTENVFFGTQEVETLIINGTTVWEKVTLPVDIDGDGVANSTDTTPAVRLAGERISGGSIKWYVTARFTNLQISHAKIHVSGGSAFAGSLQATVSLTDAGSYMNGGTSPNSLSTNINGYSNDFEKYVDYYSDLLANFAIDGNGRTKAQFGSDHWTAYGEAEGRFSRWSYFRFPVSTDAGVTYSSASTQESIEAVIPHVGTSVGSFGYTYINKYDEFS